MSTSQKIVAVVTGITLGLGLATVTHASQAKEWVYLLNPGNLGRSNNLKSQSSVSNLGVAQLFEDSPGSFTFRLQGSAADECLNVLQPAEVVRTATDLTITPEKRFASCPSLRLVIKNDGSGGEVQQQVGKRGNQTWEGDTDRSYGLTPK